MGHKKEKSSYISQSSIIKEEAYLDFFTNCDKSISTFNHTKEIKNQFKDYGKYMSLDNLPQSVVGLDSSHIEKSLYSETGIITPFNSHHMLISTLCEDEINLSALNKINKQRSHCGTVNPVEIAKINNILKLDFWFNGSNITPKNIADPKFRNPKNCFKVSLRDALKKPQAGIQVGRHEKPFLLINALYRIFESMSQCKTFHKTKSAFRFVEVPTKIKNNYFHVGVLQAFRCPSVLSSCPYSHEEFPNDIQKELVLRATNNDEIFCPFCNSVICEFDVFRMADFFQEEMTNLHLLSETSYFLEHLRCVQRLITMEEKKAVIMDGSLALFGTTQSLIEGFRQLSGNAVTSGATLFGVVKTGVLKEYSEALDSLGEQAPLKNSSFWVVRNYSRYKTIMPRPSAQPFHHGHETHYGIDVIVKTSKGLRFCLSIAPPRDVSQALYHSSMKEADKILEDINENPETHDFLLRSLQVLEEVQMILYGGSTIPQVQTHGQASLSQGVAGRILAQSIFNHHRIRGA